MKKNHYNKRVYVIVFLGIFNLILEYSYFENNFITILISILDFIILFFYLLDLIISFIKAEKKKSFLKKNSFDFLLILFFFIFFLYNQFIHLVMSSTQLKSLSLNFIILRNIYLIFKILGRIKKFNVFIKNISNHPAQVIISSFLIVIIIGAFLLNMPFAAADNIHIGFINSLFTSTSAVCVTGLTVVDTATRFSVYGQAIIMILIQIGGLGIMILSFFSAFLLGKKISLEDKMLLSYMLDEKDVKSLSKTIFSIVLATFIIEIIGALILYTKFHSLFGFNLKSLFYSFFHSISAFCNAGFALFSDNLVSFKSDGLFTITIALLIILGGIGFAVLGNLSRFFKNLIKRKLLQQRLEIVKLSVNTKAVLIITALLLVGGMFFIYGLEHQNSLLNFDLKTEYLSAFFQSTTLRTAGFNTIDFASLTIPTYLVMLLFMFIGGASGSTAGGIKVNTISVVYAYFKALFKGKSEVSLFQKSILKDTVNKAFLIIILMLSTIFAGVFLLSLVEKKPFMHLLFETVSAIGTVGLSTGITPDLTNASKFVIIVLMFIGRLGPLTIVAALTKKKKSYEIKYPEANINIG